MSAPESMSTQTQIRTVMATALFSSSDIYPPFTTVTKLDQDPDDGVRRFL